MTAHISPTVQEFTAALRTLALPGTRERAFLRAHYSAPGRARTASVLAQSAGYLNHSAINLRYGLLAARIGKVLGRRRVNLSLLVDFVRPASVTNKEWVLVMHPQFGSALKQAGWL